MPCLRPIAPASRIRGLILAVLVLVPTLVASPRSAAQSPQLLFEDPFEIPSLGLHVFLPEESLIDLSSLQGGRTNVKVFPQGESQEWVIQIWDFRSREEDLTLDQAVENLIREKLQSRVGKYETGDIRSMFRAFGREQNLLVGNMPAQRVYFDVPGDDSAAATGYTIFRLEAGHFVVFQIDCIQSSFTRNRDLYELLVASTEFRDAREMSESRAAALFAGKALLERFSFDEYLTVLTDDPRFFRVFRPAPTDDPKDAEEAGYQRVTMRRGRAGEVSGKPEARWGPSEREEGIIVIVEARMLLDDGMADSVATFYLSEDRQTELWSNRMGLKGNSNQQWTETGMRFGSKLVVTTTQEGHPPKELRWEELPSSYLSRVEAYLIPRLAVRHGLEGQYGYYAFDSFLGKLSIRRDEVRQSSPGVWAMLTRASENSPSAGTIMNDSGEIQQRDLPSGEVVQPIDQRELRRLWVDKGLPTN